MKYLCLVYLEEKKLNAEGPRWRRVALQYGVASSPRRVWQRAQALGHL